MLMEENDLLAATWLCTGFSLLMIYGSLSNIALMEDRDFLSWFNHASQNPACTELFQNFVDSSEGARGSEQWGDVNPLCSDPI